MSMFSPNDEFIEVKIEGIPKSLIACKHNCHGKHSKQRIALRGERMFDEIGIGEECRHPDSVEFQTKIRGKKPGKVFMLCAKNTTWIMEDMQNGC